MLVMLSFGAVKVVKAFFAGGGGGIGASIASTVSVINADAS